MEHDKLNLKVLSAVVARAMKLRLALNQKLNGGKTWERGYP